MRKLFYGLCVLLLIIGGGAYCLYAGLNTLVVKGVNTYGPQLTKTPVTLDRAKLSIFSGEGTLHGFSIGNSKEFKGKALAIDTVGIAIDMGTILKDVIVIKDIDIRNAKVDFIWTKRGTNFDVLNANIKASAANLTGIGSTSKASDQNGPPSVDTPEKRVIIDNLRLRGTRATLSVPILKLTKEITLPDIHLTDMGRKSNGATISKILQQLLAVILREVTTTLHKTIEVPPSLILDSSKTLFSGKADLGRNAKAIGNVLKNLFGSKKSQQ